MSPNSPDEAAPGASKRPISVLLFEVLLAVLCVVLLMGSVRIAIALATRFNEVRYPGELVFGLAWRLVSGIAAIGTAIAIHKAARIARFAGLFFFCALFVAAKIDSLSAVPPEYAISATTEGGYRLAGDFLPFVLLVWGYRFAFTAGAKKYFGSAKPVASNA